MKPSRIFLSSRFFATHLFHFVVIRQLVVHDWSPSAIKTSFLPVLRRQCVKGGNLNRIKSTLTTWMRSLPLRGEEGWVTPRSVMALMPTHDSRHHNSPDFEPRTRTTR